MMKLTLVNSVEDKRFNGRIYNDLLPIESAVAKMFHAWLEHQLNVESGPQSDWSEIELTANKFKGEQFSLRIDSAGAINKADANKGVRYIRYACDENDIGTYAGTKTNQTKTYAQWTFPDFSIQPLAGHLYTLLTEAGIESACYDTLTDAERKALYQQVQQSRSTDFVESYSMYLDAIDVPSLAETPDGMVAVIRLTDADIGTEDMRKNVKVFFEQAFGFTVTIDEADQSLKVLAGEGGPEAVTSIFGDQNLISEGVKFLNTLRSQIKQH